MKKALLIAILITGLFQLKAQADEAFKYSFLFDDHLIRLQFYAPQINEDSINIEGLDIFNDETDRFHDSNPSGVDCRITIADIKDAINAIEEIIGGGYIDDPIKDGYVVRGVPLQRTGGPDTHLPGDDNQPPGNGTNLRANSTREVQNKRMAYPGKVDCNRWDHL